MIDTGAEVNLLKKNCIKPSTKIDNTDLLQLTGITLEKQNTLGTLIIRIFREDVLFHLVDDNFPILFDGILGMDFFGSKSAIINNTLGCLSFKNMSVLFSRSEKEFMPFLQLPVGIYAGEALIKNSNGKGFFKISNTTSKQYMFEIPRLELSDFREDTLLNSGPNTSYKTNAPDSSEILSFIHTIFTEKNGEECPKLNTLEAKPSFTSSRAESVRALLRLDHLNLEEARSVSNDIDIGIDDTDVLDVTPGKVNDLTGSLTNTGETDDMIKAKECFNRVRSKKDWRFYRYLTPACFVRISARGFRDIIKSVQAFV
ncbi:hypothetical protein M0804_013203 [Polistes exclamans]|nr:hypothetical protein M0804_013203 [Polistes exclamans]